MRLATGRSVGAPVVAIDDSVSPRAADASVVFVGIDFIRGNFIDSYSLVVILGCQSGLGQNGFCDRPCFVARASASGHHAPTSGCIPVLVVC